MEICKGCTLREWFNSLQNQRDRKHIKTIECIEWFGMDRDIEGREDTIFQRAVCRWQSSHSSSGPPTYTQWRWRYRFHPQTPTYWQTEKYKSKDQSASQWQWECPGTVSQTAWPIYTHSPPTRRQSQSVNKAVDVAGSDDTPYTAGCPPFGVICIPL